MEAVNTGYHYKWYVSIIIALVKIHTGNVYGKYYNNHKYRDEILHLPSLAIFYLSTYSNIYMLACVTYYISTGMLSCTLNKKYIVHVTWLNINVVHYRQGPCNDIFLRIFYQKFENALFCRAWALSDTK